MLPASSGLVVLPGGGANMAPIEKDPRGLPKRAKAGGGDEEDPGGRNPLGLALALREMGDPGEPLKLAFRSIERLKLTLRSID